MIQWRQWWRLLNISTFCLPLYCQLTALSTDIILTLICMLGQYHNIDYAQFLPRGSWPPHSWGFLDHTQWRTTVGRTPLDKWSARRRDLYLTTQNTHNRQTSMPPVGFESTISTAKRPQTYSLDRAATWTDCHALYISLINNTVIMGQLSLDIGRTMRYYVRHILVKATICWDVMPSSLINNFPED